MRGCKKIVLLGGFDHVCCTSPSLSACADVCQRCDTVPLLSVHPDSSWQFILLCIFGNCISLALMDPLGDLFVSGTPMSTHEHPSTLEGLLTVHAMSDPDNETNHNRILNAIETMLYVIFAIEAPVQQWLCRTDSCICALSVVG